MEYLQYFNQAKSIEDRVVVLNLIINGIPSILWDMGLDDSKDKK